MLVLLNFPSRSFVNLLMHQATTKREKAYVKQLNKMCMTILLLPKDFFNYEIINVKKCLTYHCYISH